MKMKRTGKVVQITEFWSQPWHALQRSLAESFTAEPSGGRPLKGRVAADASTYGASWLARARGPAAPSPYL